jgi:RNA polymerase sigma-70 factor (ECF subfamily)
MGNNDHDPNECIAMFEKLSEYIDGELDPVTCRQIEAHLEGCLPCRIYLLTLKKTVNLCKEMTPNPVPENLSQKLRDMVDNFPQTAPRSPKR